MLTTDQKGNIAEQAIALTATRLGIGVFRPVGEGSRYDLILDLSTRLLRVQCKWCRLVDGVMVVRCQSSRRTAEGLRARAYTADEIDAFAAYCPDTDGCYLIPMEYAGPRRQIQLRLDPPRNAQRGAIVWARDFDFATLDWPRLGAVAQLAERRYGIPEAGGSSPPSSTPSISPTVTEVGAHQFRNHFGYYLERAAAGDDIRVSRHGRTFVKLSRG